MPDPSQLPLGFLINTAGRLMHARAQKVFAAEGLDPVQAGVLWNIQLMPGRTQKDYAAFQQRDPTTFGRIVDHLQAKGLIDRAAHEQDRRAWCLWLTDRGHEVLARIHQDTRAIEAAALAGLSADEAAATRRGLFAMFSNLAAAEGLPT